MELVSHVAKDHSSNNNDDTIEPRNQATLKTHEVIQSNKPEEPLDITKCSEFNDKLSEKNSLKDHTGKGKCSICTIMFYGKK